MDNGSQPELAGVYESQIYCVSLTPRPVAYDTQVVAANPISIYDHLQHGGQSLRFPTRGVNDDQFTACRGLPRPAAYSRTVDLDLLA
eukprot:5073527-Prymnesium_polylepis.1